MEDVETVDFLGLDDGNRPSKRFPLDFGTEQVALPFAELLGVVEEGVVVVWRKDDGSSDDRPGEGTASGFVASRLSAAVYETRG